MDTKSGGNNNPIAFDVPTLIVRGDDDQIVPIEASARLSSKLVPRATLKICPGVSTRLGDTSKDQFNADLQEFVPSRIHSWPPRLWPSANP